MSKFSEIKMFCFDIDGTILPYGDKQLKPEILAMFKKLKQKGYTITIATGREYPTIGNIIEQIKVVDYFVGSNGAFIWDVRKQKEIYSNYLDIEECKSVIGDLQNASSSLTLTDDKYIYATTKIDTNNWFLEKYRHIIKPLDFEIMNRDKLSKITLAHTHETAIEKIQNILDAHNSSLVITAQWSKGSFVANKNVNKMFAVNFLATKLGFKAKNIISFGDGSNDFEMIEGSGIGVSVHGSEDCEPLNDAVADYIIDSPENLGVVNFCKEHKII